MPDFILSLGDVDFQDFEIPDEINGGGGQAIDIKRYAGGQRTLDAFGADDKPISWSGMFEGENAEARCQQLDTMRRAGVPLPLTFGAFNFTVIIRGFDWRYQRFFQIPYSIELEVVQDNVQPAADDDDQGGETDMQGDVDDANDCAEAMDV